MCRDSHAGCRGYEMGTTLAVRDRVRGHFSFLEIRPPLWSCGQVTAQVRRPAELSERVVLTTVHRATPSRYSLPRSNTRRSLSGRAPAQSVADRLDLGRGSRGRTPRARGAGRHRLAAQDISNVIAFVRSLALKSSAAVGEQRGADDHEQHAGRGPG
jgi:hypothetical protein